MNWIGIEGREPSHLGFIYKVTNIRTGQFYIGKKQFSNKIRRKPLKGLKRIRRDMKESNWQEYYGSCNKLLADIDIYGEDNFKREILRFCSSKFELAYFELKAQLNDDVLFNPLSYNEIINIRLHRRKY